MTTFNQELDNFNTFCGESYSLLNVKFAQEIASIFGQDCFHLIQHYKSSIDPKGYHGPAAEGVTAFVLSRWLCDKLNLSYTRCHGRGRQHRNCCHELRTYWADGMIK